MLVSLAASASQSQVADRRSRPNLVLITIDTVRADHIGCYGYKGIKTPNIDALAADGTRMERAYTPVPITLPSHAVMFTGTYPMKTGMHDFSGNTLGAEQQTLASVLKQHGYDTGAVVGSAVLDSRFGLNRGFDFYYDHFDFSRLLETNLDAMERPGNLVADEALQWFGKRTDKPFFFWMHLYDPHHPYNPPSPYAEEYKTAPYDGEIAFADAQVGRVLDILKKRGHYQNTLVVLTGDHGEGLGEHGETTHGFFIYNSTLHVPLIFKWPSAMKVRKISRVPVSLVDLMPTVLAALKIAAPSEVQGRSLLPVIEGKKDAEASPLYAESFLPRLHFNWSELRGVQVRNYRFIHAPKPELYDLASDPGETTNLYAQKKPLSQELEAELNKTIAAFTPSGEQTANRGTLDPALAERLQSLGYAAFSGGTASGEANHNLPDPKDRIQFYETFSTAMNEGQRGKYAESIAKLRALLKIEPDSIPVNYLLGLNHYKSQQFKDAVQAFQTTVKLSPEYALANYYLGLAQARSGNVDAALASFNRTLQLDPTNFSAAFNAGSAYAMQGNMEQAIAAFRRSIEINPSYAEGHRALGEVLMYRGQLEQAIAELRQAVGLAPGDPRVHVSLAKALKAKGLDREAQEHLRQAQAAQAERARQP